MADTFKFELITPERMVLSADASQVLVPGFEGEFTVLPGHAPVISALRPGVVDAALADTRKVSIAVPVARSRRSRATGALPYNRVRVPHRIAHEPSRVC